MSRMITVSGRPGADCAFDVVKETDEYIIVRDLCGDGGEWKSVTNGAEEVVKHLIEERFCKMKRIYYYDTDNRLDELDHDGEKFIGFKPGGPA